jgi:hypothetical protein
MPQTFTQWQQSDQYPAGDAPFRTAETAGPQPVFHDELDALRSMWRRTPEADYPDGYIGTVDSKRRARLRNNEPQNMRHDGNQPFRRGVHKGERLDAQSYFWPPEFQPFSALEYEAAGMKYVIPGVLSDAGMMQLDLDPAQPQFNRVAARGVPGRVGTAVWGNEEPNRSADLRRLAPQWSGMGMSVPYAGR